MSTHTHKSMATPAQAKGRTSPAKARPHSAQAARPVGRQGGKPRGAIGQEKTLEQLAAEQQVKPVARVEDVLGAGRDLWDSDEDFASFLQAAHRPIEERV